MKQMLLASRTGLPPMRPLYFDFLEDEMTYRIGDQFMFGADILVAPVLVKGATSRRIYLPAGEKWRSITSPVVYEGGQWIEIEAPLDVIPFLLRADAELQITLEWFSPLIASSEPDVPFRAPGRIE